MWVCSAKTWIVGSCAEFCCKKCKQITCHSHILLLCGWYSVSIRRGSVYVDLWIQLRQLASRSVSWVEFVHFVLKKRGNQRRVSLFFISIRATCVLRKHIDGWWGCWHFFIAPPPPRRKRSRSDWDEKRNAVRNTRSDACSQYALFLGFLL